MRNLNFFPLGKLCCLVSIVGMGACSSSADMIAHFNQLAAAPDSQPERLIESLQLQAGNVVADIGAGGGYYTFALAQAVGEGGVVYAVDIEAAYLAHIRTLARKNSIEHVRTVLAGADDAGLPTGALDVVFVRNTFHDIARPQQYFAALRSSLRSGGRVAIIDYRPAGIITRLHGHYIPEQSIVASMQRAGYRRIQRFDFLKEQSYNIFTPARPVHGTDR